MWQIKGDRMAREKPVVLSTRITDAEAVQIDVAAALRAVTRSTYRREAVAEAAGRELSRLGQRGARTR